MGAKQRGAESLEVKEVLWGKALWVRESWRLYCVEGPWPGNSRETLVGGLQTHGPAR